MENEIQGCHQQPIGMQSGTIPDLALSSSSAFDIRLGPQHARLVHSRSTYHQSLSMIIIVIALHFRLQNCL
ncbi:hypothetical protein DAPPUDRAFT_262291 [Daphnia pulex]|uniref:Uncharacterized protein n=1 Tax=Daphnia pulex TaxID=6669 RepID=E9HMR9_DAPPU|nr:hypothetical protein DAPPUDRAFT_262291 [Daphnia pulex]|eukprot:EFX66953.1 hypothetical protein DAPPUDRAFT_262291 [Daphnia pulex]